mmetsp:Transcript_1173/g.3265  ORF Transcript_1173/g.3265 Transcript_1173/m.3265 type:complete len:357 (+) Transcript_1173:52-1122(+)|eukprot:CAMPEP_0168747670 /NCGR_PEP_ID=MMETSP0724-20121128/15778_1 /TAXON_ID=265536 /ORGANISM="Amphiprora sp., Strain CCMP467" /LENGTH=356 /DNA_ID=CAMNT_0008795471 /DNA_START=32 /DNA_END=1102 /DNA_ORIENTATION=+
MTRIIGNSERSPLTVDEATQEKEIAVISPLSCTNEDDKKQHDGSPLVVDEATHEKGIAVVSPMSCTNDDDKKQEEEGVPRKVDAMLLAVGLTEQDSTTTKANWCLREGLIHVAKLDEAKLLPLIVEHGVPKFYSLLEKGSNCGKINKCRHEATQDLKNPQTCFQSLCRIIVGQCINGKAAQASWKRLNECVQDSHLVPQAVLDKTGTSKSQLEKFRKAVGVNGAKAKCLADLAQHFVDEKLSEEMLQSASEADVRKALLSVKGIGEWSCDMFLMFYLERRNILPLGDLGVRKGITQHFWSKSRKKLVCAKTNRAEIDQKLEKYSPYWSLVSYYMWRVTDANSAAAMKKKAVKRKLS